MEESLQSQVAGKCGVCESLVFNIFTQRTEQLFGVRVELREVPGAVLMLPVVSLLVVSCAIWKMERFQIKQTSRKKLFYG